MNVRSIIRYPWITALLILTLTCLDGGCGGSSSNTLMLQVQGTIQVTDVGPVNPLKLGVAPEQQVFLEPIIIEVKDNFEDGLGINLTQMDFSVSFNEGYQVQLKITPQINEMNPTANTGLLFKRQDGVPLGDSTVNLGFEFILPGENPVPIEVQGIADQNDPNRIPVLGNIPVVNFLFNGRQKEAQITELVILITPEIVDQLD